MSDNSLISNHLSRAHDVLMQQLRTAVQTTLQIVPNKLLEVAVLLDVEGGVPPPLDTSWIAAAATEVEKCGKRSVAGGAAASVALRITIKRKKTGTCTNKSRTVGSKGCTHDCEASLETGDSNATSQFEVDAKLIVPPVHVIGKYRKHRRDISQTQWLLDDTSGRVTNSVEQILGDVVMSYFPTAAAYSLHGAGREDVDVRMLGEGRLFVLSLSQCFDEEPINATDKQPLNAEALQSAINEHTMPLGVQVRDVQVYVERDTTTDVRKAVAILGEQKEKEYALVARTLGCDFSEEDVQTIMQQLGSVEGFVMKQKTPIRVLHRRACLVRPRRCRVLKAELVNASHLALLLRTEAGAYVKEFVSGDFGRTVPSLASVLRRPVDLVQLDVLDLHLRGIDLSNITRWASTHILAGAMTPAVMKGVSSDAAVDHRSGNHERIKRQRIREPQNNPLLF